MSFYGKDDKYDDDLNYDDGYSDDYKDDVESADDDGGGKDKRSAIRSSINPFSGGSGGARPTSGLPGRDRSPVGGGGSISRDDLRNRPSGGGAPGSGGGGFYSNRGAGGGTYSSRPTGGGSTYGSRPGGGAPGSSGGNTFRTGGTGGLGGTRPTGDLNRPKAEPPKNEEKKPEEKPANPLGGAANRLSGIMGRVGIAGKKDGDDKPADKPAEGEKGVGIADRFRAAIPIPGKKDGDSKPADQPADGEKGGLFGKLRAQIPIVKKGDDAAPADKPADQPADKPKAGGGFGIPLRSPLGRREGEAKPADKPAEQPADKPKAGGLSMPALPRLRPGGGGGDAKAEDKPAKAQAAEGGGGLLSGLRLPFVGGGEAKKDAPKTSKTRASKVPVTENEGMSLDTKLDIVGVALVFSAFMLFVSSLSTDQGALTGSVNRFFSQLFGWGAVGVPLVMFAVGVWLILRHFGDEAPRIAPLRLVGAGLAFISILILFQYIEMFNPLYNTADMATLRIFIEEFTVKRGQGGGLVGSQLYMLLVQNLTEPGGFVILLGMFVISAMLITDTSSAELAAVVISAWRSFQVARQRRAQIRRARALEKMQADPAALAAPPISVTRPPAPELPAAQVMPQPALPPLTLPEAEPLALPIEERGIPIRMGGQMVTAAADPLTDEPLRETGAPPAYALPASVPAAHVSPTPATPPAEPPRRFPFRRGRGAEPPETPSEAAPAREPAAPLWAGIGRRSAEETPDGNRQRSLFGRRPVEPKPDEAAAPAAPAPAASAPTAPGSGLPLSAVPPEMLDSALSAPAETAYMPSTPQPIPVIPPPVAAEAPPAVDAPAASAEPAVPAASAAPVSPGAGRMSRLDQIRAGMINRPGVPNIPAQPAAAQPSAADPVPGPAVVEPAPLAEPAPAPTPAEDAPVIAAPDVTEAAPLSPFARPVRSAPAQPAAESEAVPPAASPAFASRVRPFTGASTPAAASPAATSPAAQQPASQRPAAAGGTGVGVYNPVRSGEPEPRPFTPAISAPSAPDTPPVMQPSAVTNPARVRRAWNMPEANMLLKPGSEQDFDREALVKRARVIEETLSSFGAPGRVVEINTGPVITQFGVEPDYLTARGGKKNRVKVSAIAQLDKDLQLALGAKAIRIEAPVPGKGFVGVEVPNDQAATVSLRDVMEAREFQRIKSPLAIALGQSVDGTPVAADLTAMPHLLIAGTTGSGKSVCVNSIIASLLLRNTPEQVKFIMVDPKRVELTGYNGIPHLIAPVVVELERIVGVLKWVTREMDERYKKFSNAGARNIEDYNKHLSPNEERMPYIVVIIDELADLMMLAPDETERVITRIAALARATGIHLVIATQRPSVDVVTGLIKANFPARIAFAVASGIDSRVILDQPGAERLLGRGDMLYMSGDAPAPQRLQGVFVSDMEINNITRFWRQQQADAPQRPITALMADDGPAEPQPRPAAPAPQRAAFTPAASAPARTFWDADEDDEDDDSVAANGRERENGEDEMYDEAVELVRRLGKASVSLLQRRLRIGYTRAARLIDLMEERGVVGPATEGSKPRDVLPMK